MDRGGILRPGQDADAARAEKTRRDTPQAPLRQAPRASPGFEPFLPPRTGLAPPPRPASQPGIRLPDFDAPPEPDPAIALAAAAAAEAEAAAAAAAAEAAARLEAARRAGHAAGEAAGLAAAAADQAERSTRALEAIAAALAAQEAALVAAAEASAQALAELLLGALDAALPEAAARLAPDCAARLATVLAPLLAEGKAVTLFVPPGQAEAVAARLADPRLGLAEDAALALGDARAEWRGGGATLSLAARRQAVTALLASFGLTPTTEEC